MKAKHIWIIAAVVAVVAAVAITVACLMNTPEGDRVYGVGEEGVYYYEVIEGKVTLTLNTGDFTLTGTINKTGTYTVDGDTIRLDFYKDSDGSATATLDGDTLNFVYNDATIPFHKSAEYTVTFNVDGGSEIAYVRVFNGHTVAKPANDPIKPGYQFLGWYADAECTVKFDFESTAIRANTVIYARWIEDPLGI